MYKLYTRSIILVVTKKNNVKERKWTVPKYMVYAIHYTIIIIYYFSSKIKCCYGRFIFYRKIKFSESML